MNLTTANFSLELVSTPSDDQEKLLPAGMTALSSPIEADPPTTNPANAAAGITALSLPIEADPPTTNPELSSRYSPPRRIIQQNTALPRAPAAAAATDPRAPAAAAATDPRAPAATAVAADPGPILMEA